MALVIVGAHLGDDAQSQHFGHPGNGAHIKSTCSLKPQVAIMLSKSASPASMRWFRV
jgi:hypothetical protein